MSNSKPQSHSTSDLYALLQSTLRSFGLGTYSPLLWIVGLVTFVAGLLTFRYGLGGQGFMTAWMAGVLLVFSLLKLFNISGFAADFQKYDLIAGRFPAYAMAYPFVELGLACLLIVGAWPLLVNALIVVVFAIGSLGVLRAIRRGDNLQCACVGRMFDLPLSKVALVEDISMVVMGLAMIVWMIL